MGTIKGGVLGGFNGKVGAVVGSHWKGKASNAWKVNCEKGKIFCIAIGTAGEVYPDGQFSSGNC